MTLPGTPIIVLAPSQNLRHRMFRANSSSHGFAAALHRQVAVPSGGCGPRSRIMERAPPRGVAWDDRGRLEDFVVVTRDRTIAPPDAAASGTG
jgi:hypothetical protein